MMLALLAGLCFGADVHAAYARQDTAALRGYLAAAPSREAALLTRYRLYALTREDSLLRSIPADLPDGSARERALLSALWAWRIPGSAPWNVVRYGRRSVGLLDRAVQAAPDDPLVALIEAQSLLFRPGVAGGDGAAATRKLRALAARLASEEDCAVPRMEAEVWVWYALHHRGEPDSGAARARLLAAPLPPLYRAFLDAPP